MKENQENEESGGRGGEASSYVTRKWLQYFSYGPDCLYTLYEQQKKQKLNGSQHIIKLFITHAKV